MPQLFRTPFSKDELLDYRSKLNSISPSFCSAKWKQVTLHLQSGLTHSCHHPTPHIIPVDEITVTPSALHNTKFKKEQRKMMKEGQRPPECNYCWGVEDLANDVISDRVYKSAEEWSDNYLTEIKNLPWDANVNPSYLEVSFNSVCNLKCSYCGPQFSSAWMEEIQILGPYPTSNYYNSIEHLKENNTMPIAKKEHNPYIDAFWQWWPEIYPTLDHFRITGGEPLLSRDTFKVLDYIIENPNPNMELSINSNMSHHGPLFDRFVEKIKQICEQKKIKKFKIFTSCEAHGKHAEYIRHGLSYDLWLSNIKRILAEVPECTFTVTSTFNALSIVSYKSFLKDILDIKKEFGGIDKDIPIIIDIPYLRQPSFLSMFILPSGILPYLEDIVTFMYNNKEVSDWKPLYNRGFFQFEIDKFIKLIELFKEKSIGDTITTVHKDFVAFVNEHDMRRGTNFVKTFPKLENL